MLEKLLCWSGSERCLLSSYTARTTLLAGELAYRENTKSDATQIPELPIPSEHKSRVALTPEQEKQQRDYLVTFFSHTIRVFAAAGSLGLAVAAMVISGGSGLPYTLIVGTALVVAVVDAMHAVLNYN